MPASPLFKTAIVVVLVSAVAPVSADVVLPSVLSSRMVLQRERAIPMWGQADAGEAVSVSLAGKTVSAVAGPDGAWRVMVGPLGAGGPYQLVVKGNNTVTLDDVLVGDVWICGGQSNMELSVSRADCADAVKALPANQRLRFFRVPHVVAQAPTADVKAAWKVADAESTMTASAVGYAFASELQHELDVPIGVVQCTYSGTPAEAWISVSTLASPALERVRGRIAKESERAPADRARWEAETEQWKVALAQWEADFKAGKVKEDTKPKQPAMPLSIAPHRQPNVLFNGMVAPLAPYAARGMIWYQGESNGNFGAEYRELLMAVIGDWRANFQSPEMPVGVVQLPNFKHGTADYHGPLAWTEVREAQLMAAQHDANVGLVVTIDVGDPDNLHPTNKAIVGSRLALWAKAKVYGQHVEYSGPTMKSARVDGATYRITFDHADGLAARGGEPLRGIAIAGPDHVFIDATAAIEDGEVVASAPGVATPVALRYAWAKNPAANLVNAAGLPASPFRTDDWPVPIVGPPKR